MTAFQPIRATHARLVVACLATLALVLAACSSANPPASPSASASSSTGPEPSASQAPSATRTATLVGSPAPANQPQTIHVIVDPINDTFVRVGSLTGCTNATSCQGDYLLGDDPLFDAATGKEVGTLAYECFIVDTGSSLYHCPGITIDLTGRGQIVYGEVIQHEVGKPPAVAPITGGTGEFLGATGFVTSKKLADGGDLVITFTK